MEESKVPTAEHVPLKDLRARHKVRWSDLPVRSRLYRSDPYEAVDLSAIAEMDLRGWNSNDKNLAELILTYKPELIVEVGTWKGASAIWMAQAAERLLAFDSKPREIVCVDTWLGALEFLPGKDYDPGEDRDLKLMGGYPQVYYQFAANVMGKFVDDFVTPFPATSLCAASWFKREKLLPEFVYVDGSHEYDDVMADLKAWADLGPRVICGDDWCGWEQVRRAVMQFFTVRKEWELRSHCEFWWAVRKEDA